MKMWLAPPSGLRSLLSLLRVFDVCTWENVSTPVDNEIAILLSNCDLRRP